MRYIYFLILRSKNHVFIMHIVLSIEHLPLPPLLPIRILISPPRSGFDFSSSIVKSNPELKGKVDLDPATESSLV